MVDRLSFGHELCHHLGLLAGTLLQRGADDVDRLGFDETFRRMWSFYLAYSEAGFRSGYLDVVQLVLTRTRLRLGGLNWQQVSPMSASHRPSYSRAPPKGVSFSGL